jgi:hypothetical protein
LIEHYSREKMLNQEKNQMSYHRIERSELPHSTVVNSTRAPHKYEKTTKQVGLAKWFSLREDSFVLLIRILCILLCCAFWYGAYRLVKIFLL